MTFNLQNNTTTHQQLRGWHFTFPMHYFFTLGVLPFGYGQIYNILSDNKQYDVTIGNFLGCSCVYFVAMSVASLGGHEAYVQCKHMYHILQTIFLWAH